MIIQPGAAAGLWPHSRECAWQNVLRHGKGVELVAGEFDRHTAGSVLSSLVGLQRSSQGRVVLTQRRQHLSAVRAGWRDGSRHGCGGAGGSTLGAILRKPKPGAHSSPLNA